MTLTTEEYKTNEKYFLTMLKLTKNYFWIDKGENFNLETGKMKPATLRGYVELSALVRRPFMDLFVELPNNTMGMSKETIWRMLDDINNPKPTKKRTQKK
jgi:hypothetical protein